MLLKQYKTGSDYNLTFLNVLVSNDRKIRDVVITIQDWIRLQPHLPECADYNLTFLNVLVSNDRKIRDVVITIQDWIRLQPHLPECADYNLTFLNVLVSNDRKIRDVVITIQDWIRLQPHLPECADYNLTFLNVLVSNDRKIRDVVITIQDWIRLQPHLPECADYNLTFLNVLVSNNRKIRDDVITIQDWIRQQPHLHECAVNTVKCNGRKQFIPLPGLLDDLTQVVINRFVSTEDKHFELIQFMKISVMIGDLLVSNACSLGFHVVVDLSNYSLGVIRQFTPVILKKMQLILTKAYPVRIKSIHFVNAPVFVDKLVTLVKMVLVPKLSKRIIVHTSGLGSLHDHISPKYLPLEYGGELGPVQDLWGELYIIVHTSGLGSLHDHISPKYLPLEYGGELGPVQDMWDSWTKELISKRDWFLEQENISSDEKRRPGKPLDQSELFGMEGSFKKLSVD
uniref:CRAL-TRIO domain-containing protein n=2 Tax=Timema TaxID=61471 RepID=A0A7R9EJ78_9NEOP|nr:unnamed protein product [Timema monikensis]